MKVIRTLLSVDHLKVSILDGRENMCLERHARYTLESGKEGVRGRMSSTESVKSFG